MLKNYHKILGVEPDASKEQIKRAYHRLVLQYHPDVNKAPDAHERFLEIKDAYIQLTRSPIIKAVYKASARPTVIKKKRTKEEQAKYERAKEDARLRQQGLYNLVLFTRYFIKYMTVVTGLLIAVIPVLYSIKYSEKTIPSLILTVPLWGAGIWVMVYVIKNSKSFFDEGKFDKFDFSFFELSIKGQPATENCFFCKEKKADGVSFTYKMFKLKNIKLHNQGALNHQASYQSVKKTIILHRSRKAVIVHRLTKIVKFIAIILSIIFVPFESTCWRIIFGIIISSLIAEFICIITRTMPDTFYLRTWSNLIRLLIIASAIFSASSFGGVGIIMTKDFFPFLVIVSIFVSDILVTPVSFKFFQSPFLFPGVHQHPEIDDLLDKGFQNGSPGYFNSVFFPFYKWLF